jgi:flagellar hook-length control protein FliK
MKTDALQSFTGGNDIAPKRMDCTRNRRIDGERAEFVTDDKTDVERRPFRKVMEDVAADNKAAQRITGETVERKTAPEPHGNRRVSIKDEEVTQDPETEKLTPDKDVMATTDSNEVVEAPEGAEPGLKDDVVVPVDAETAEQAEAIIRDALTEISDALGIKVFQGLENLSLSEITGDTKEQFAEIVFILKKLVQGIELGKATGMPVETPKATLGGGDLDKLADVLRSGAFKIEMACNVLGIAGDVQEKVAERLELTVASGIIQAVDPKTISMSSQHVERLFAGVGADDRPADGLASLIDKVKKLISGKEEVRPVVLEVQGESPAEQKTDVRIMETRVYRALLKIDKVDQTGQQNQVAAGEIAKSDLPKTQAAGVPLAQALADVVRKDAVDGPAGVPDIKPVIQQAAQANAESRIAGSLLKMTDDTVMEQITGRMQTVIRTGLTEVRIQLRPESLGEVSMRIRIEGDVVQARIEVQNQQVKEIMERNLPALKDALAQQNLASGSIDIHVGSGNGRHSGSAQQGPWEQDQTAQNGAYRHGKDHEDAATGDEQQQGEETGRRFGGNSVEYFA